MVTPDEKPKKRRSIGTPNKEEPEKIEPSIDEPDHIQVDTVNENDLKPSSKPSSRRGSKKETSPEPKTIEVQTLLAATEMAFFKSFSPIYVIQYVMLHLICGRLQAHKNTHTSHNTHEI